MTYKTIHIECRSLLSEEYENTSEIDDTLNAYAKLNWKLIAMSSYAVSIEPRKIIVYTLILAKED